MDSRKYTCGIFIDLKKAFDTVNHSILLAKLENCGIRGLVNNWLQSYVTNRRQSIEIDNYISKEEKKPSVEYPKAQFLAISYSYYILTILINVLWNSLFICLQTIQV